MNLLSFFGVLIAGVVLVLGLAYVVLERWIGPRDRAREEARIAELITPLGPAQYRFTGHNDALRVNGLRRRELADARRREAASIASGKPAKSGIHLVVNG